MKRALDVLTAAAYLTLLAGLLASGDTVVALIPATAYALLAIFAFDHVRGSVLTAAYVVVQLGLGYAGFVLSHVGVGALLLLLVLVAQSALLLPTPWLVAVVAVVPFVHLGMAWREGVREGLGTLTAAVLTALMTRLHQREQAARHQLQASFGQAERLAAAQERNRVARDIHDGLGHALTVVQMQVKAARAVLGVDPARADAVLEKAERQAVEALAEVRRSVAALREPRSVPLPESLRRLADETSAMDVPTSVDVTGIQRPLADDAEESLYRAAQEGLTNVRKHAGARRATVVLDYRPDLVRLTVSDDGAGTPTGNGPDPAAGDSARGSGGTGGFGLLGLRERAAQLDGRLTLESIPGNGCTLTFEVPA